MILFFDFFFFKTLFTCNSAKVQDSTKWLKHYSAECWCHVWNLLNFGFCCCLFVDFSPPLITIAIMSKGLFSFSSIFNPDALSECAMLLLCCHDLFHQ